MIWIIGYFLIGFILASIGFRESYKNEDEEITVIDILIFFIMVLFWFFLCTSYYFHKLSKIYLKFIAGKK